MGTQPEGVTGLRESSKWVGQGSLEQHWSWSRRHRLGRPWHSARMWWDFSGAGEFPVCLHGVGSHTLHAREPFLPPLSRYRGGRHTSVKGSEVSDGGFSETEWKDPASGLADKSQHRALE